MFILILGLTAAEDALAFLHPPDGAVFPRDLAPPLFSWRGGNGPWRLDISASGLGETSRLVQTDFWRPEPDLWTALCQAGLAAPLTVRIRTTSGSGEASIRLRCSPDPVACRILYREVPLPFSYAVTHPDTIRWRLLDPASTKPPPVVLENLPVCGNCHSSDRRATVLGLDVDYANDKGSYAIVPLQQTEEVLTRERIITWSDYRREDAAPTFGLLSRVSPDGRYVVSTVKDRSIFVPRPDLMYSQVFFPIQGILAIHDRQTGRIFALPGADDPTLVQSSPEWSPDMRWIYFCRAPAQTIAEDAGQRRSVLTAHLADDYLAGRKTLRYDIWRVPFTQGKGGIAEPVQGAGGNDRSNYFPRISPDGRWLVFCQSKQFMLLQPDSELWLVPVDGGQAQRLACNTNSMNSWHSWSPNSRWMAFASKLRGAYTQICLAHIDDQGRAAPPLVLETALGEKRACNLPEFLNLPPGRDLRLGERFLDHYNYSRQGLLLLQSGDADRSLDLFRRALDLKPTDHETRLRLAVALDAAGQGKSADQELARLLTAFERDTSIGADLLYETHGLVALRHRRQNRLDEAISHYHRCLAVRPEDVEIRINLALIHALRQELPTAETLLNEAVQRQPAHASALLWLGQIRKDQGRPTAAIEAWHRALAAPPRDQQEWLLVARRLHLCSSVQDDFTGFITRYLKRFPTCAEGRILAAKSRLLAGQRAEAIEHLEAARQLTPDQAWIPAKIEELRQQSGGSR